MNLFWHKNRKNVEPQNSVIIPGNERYKKFLDFVIKEIQFEVNKIIENRYFGANVIIKRGKC